MVLKEFSGVTYGLGSTGSVQQMGAEVKAVRDELDNLRIFYSTYKGGKNVEINVLTVNHKSPFDKSSPYDFAKANLTEGLLKHPVSSAQGAHL